jgi:5-carboxymethyl-2-hydroxymuconate isomerase
MEPLALPHLRLEYSSNIKEQLEEKKLFSACHHVLEKVANANPLQCQSRVVCFDTFYVGNGSENEAFIYLEISLLEGRTQAMLEEAGNQIREILKSYFAHSLQHLTVQLAVRIVEMEKVHYFKLQD